jgi:hypothetical protein
MLMKIPSFQKSQSRVHFNDEQFIRQVFLGKVLPNAAGGGSERGY